MLFNFQGSSLRLQGLYSTISSSVCQELFSFIQEVFFAPGVPRETASLIYHTPYPKVNTFFVFLFFKNDYFLFFSTFYKLMKKALTFFLNFAILIGLNKIMRL